MVYQLTSCVLRRYPSVLWLTQGAKHKRRGSCPRQRATLLRWSWVMVLAEVATRGTIAEAIYIQPAATTQSGGGESRWHYVGPDRLLCNQSSTINGALKWDLLKCKNGCFRDLEIASWCQILVTLCILFQTIIYCSNVWHNLMDCMQTSFSLYLNTWQ